MNIGDEVAARVSPAAKRGGVAQYILAKVTKIVPVANNKLKYEVVDEEPGDEQEGAGLAAPQKKTYTLPRESIILLKNIYGEFPKGATVLAMYPHTTTFYPATVITPATVRCACFSPPPLLLLFFFFFPLFHSIPPPNCVCATYPLPEKESVVLSRILRGQ